MTASPERGTRFPRSVVDDVKRRFKGIGPERARSTIRPTTLSAEELIALGLPPKPNKELQPRLYHAWLQAFGGRNLLLDFAFEVKLLENPDFEPDFREQGREFAAASRFAASRNWSGASIEADDDQDFMLVLGVWTVPDVAHVPPATNNLPYLCSNWIGLDGQRRYFDSSLPQIGTVTKVLPPYDKPAAAEAWTQWWDREEPLPPVTIEGFDVAPNDRVFAALFVTDPMTVKLTIVNLSKPQPLPTMPITVTSPAVHRTKALVEHPRISGSTAEWILERPLIPDSTALANFPAYDPTKFDICLAAMSETTGLAGWLTATERTLKGARLIRMYERLHDPERTQFISMPTRIGHLGVALTYGDTAF